MLPTYLIIYEIAFKNEKNLKPLEHLARPPSLLIYYTQ